MLGHRNCSEAIQIETEVYKEECDNINKYMQYVDWSLFRQGCQESYIGHD